MKGKKIREIRNALVMVIVMVAMMSTATFAWFSMTSDPTVTGLEMVASSTSGLSVSDKANGNFYNAIELPQDNMNKVSNEDLLRLVPVAINSYGGDTGFSVATYDPTGKVNGLSTEVMTDANLKGYVARYTYYIKSESGTVEVGINTGNSEQDADISVTEGNQATAAGTFVRDIENSTETDKATEQAAYATRIGLYVHESDSDAVDFTKLIVLEPNCNGVLQYQDTSKGALTADGYTSRLSTPKVKFGTDGRIESNDPTNGTTKSVVLFEVGETPKKVSMYIWLEGDDPQCVDQIRTDQIEAQIQFTSLGEVAPTP